MADQDNDLQKQLHGFLATRRASLSPTPAPLPTKPQKPAAPKDLKTEASSFLTKTRTQMTPPPPKPVLGPGQRVAVDEPYPKGIQPGARAFFDQHPALRAEHPEILDDLSHQAETAKEDPKWGANSWWLHSANRYLVEPFNKIDSLVDKGLERSKAFKEQERLANYSFFDRLRGKQVSLEEEALRHPQG